MVMPLYDDNPFKLRRAPFVSWSLIAANFVVFFIEVGRGSQAQAMIEHVGLVPGAFIGEFDIPGALWPVLTLVTYMFLHADLWHLLGNMIFLWVFGDNVEQALGRRRFLTFYLAAGVLAALAFVLTDLHSKIPLIGASGAISGVVIGYLMLRPCAKITALVFGIPMRISAYWIVGVFIVVQFANLGSASASEIAYWCHIGGMAAGAALFPVLRQPGVELFQCLQPDPSIVPAESMPDTSSLPGAPGPR